MSDAPDRAGPSEGEGKAVVLLSGGLDSTTVLAIAHASGQACHCLTVAYGQRHAHELEAAHRIVEAIGAAEHRVVTIDLRAIGGSALTDQINVPRGRNADEMGSGVPVTYVPARNLVFMSIAAGYAEVIGARDIFVGVNAVDYSGYPDCRPAFIEAFEKVANLGTRIGVEGSGLRVHAPLLWLTKAQIIKRGIELGVDYSLTHSCYDPDETGAACGHCDSCLLRKKGFAEAGVPDPTRYRG